MRNLITITAVICLLFSCKTNCPEQPNVPEPIIIKDTVYIDNGLLETNDSLRMVIVKMNHHQDSLNLINKRLATELLNERLVVQNAKYYVNIVNKNKSQQKFLLGWMNRALNN